MTHINDLNNLFAMVKEFHEHFKVSCNDKPGPIDEEIANFRETFLDEELDEISTGYLKNDMEAVLDGLVDLVYVALGTAHLHGFNFNEAFRRVHAANMHKVRANSASDSKRNYSGDIVKPPGWTAPDLSDLTE